MTDSDNDLTQSDDPQRGLDIRWTLSLQIASPRYFTHGGESPAVLRGNGVGGYVTPAWSIWSVSSTLLWMNLFTRLST